jgi:hypothetical protein
MRHHGDTVANENCVRFRVSHKARHERVVGCDQDNRVLLAPGARKIEDSFQTASTGSRDRKSCRQATEDVGAFRMAMKPDVRTGGLRCKRPVAIEFAPDTAMDAETTPGANRKCAARWQ